MLVKNNTEQTVIIKLPINEGPDIHQIILPFATELLVELMLLSNDFDRLLNEGVLEIVQPKEFKELFESGLQLIGPEGNKIEPEKIKSPPDRFAFLDFDE